MPSITKKLLPAILCIATLLIASCDRNSITSSQSSDNDKSTSDSSSLRVAILPIRECDILQYACESGLASDMGLDLEFIPYDALMDIDTAILTDVAHVYFEDSLRISRIKTDSIRPIMLLPVPVELKLVANKDKEIKDIHGLKTNMVALTRWSQLEEWMTYMTGAASMEQTDIYHAQINSLPVRFNMANGGLIDAAILPQPWADSLLNLGHANLCDTILDGMGFFISPSAHGDSYRQRQAQLLRKVYLEAIKKQSK